MNHYIDVVSGEEDNVEVIKRINITSVDRHDDIRKAIFELLDKKYGKENVNSFQTSLELESIDKEFEKNIDFNMYKISKKESLLCYSEEMAFKRELTKEKLTSGYISKELPDLIAKLNGFETGDDFTKWRFSKADQEIV